MNTTEDDTIVYRFVHEPGSASQVLEVLTLLFIMIVALSANIVAFTTIVKDKKLRRNPHNLLVLNLILMDLGISISSMPFSVISIFDGGYLLLKYHSLCELNGFCASFFTFGNFTTVLFIAADRYLAVVWSTRFPSTRRRVLIMITIAMILSLFVGAAPLTERLSHYHYSSSTHHCSPAWMNCFFYIFNFTFIYGLAVPTMFISHAIIIYKLRAKEKKLRSYGVSKSGKAQTSKDTNDRVAASVTTTTIAATSKGIRPATNVTAMEGKEVKCAESLEQISLSAKVAAREKMERGPSFNSLSADFGETSDTIGTSELDLSSSDMAPRGAKIPDEAAKSRGAKTKRDKQTYLAMKWQSLSVDKQVAVAGALVVLTTVVCWAPYTMVNACFIEFTPSHEVGVVTMWLGYTNAMLDPLIYAFFNRQIRTKIVRQFHDCLSCLN